MDLVPLFFPLSFPSLSLFAQVHFQDKSMNFVPFPFLSVFLSFTFSSPSPFLSLSFPFPCLYFTISLFRSLFSLSVNETSSSAFDGGNSLLITGRLDGPQSFVLLPLYETHFASLSGESL